MLAQLGNAGTWLRINSRRLLPPSGRPYELFDGSVFLFGYALYAYVLTSPPPETTAGLPPLRFITEMQLGAIATLMAFAGIVLSYSHEKLWLGYTFSATAFGLLAVNFAAAWTTGDWARGAGLSAWVFVNSFRRLMRDNRDK